MLKRRKTIAVVLPALVSVFAPLVPALAQQNVPELPAPRLLIVSPAGARAGTTVEVTLSGQDIEDPEKLLFSQPGIVAEVLARPAAEGAAPKSPPNAGRPAESRFKVTVPADTPLGIHDIRVVNRWGVSNPRAFVVGDLPEVVEKEPNNDVAEAQRLALNSTVHGNIQATSDVDYYRFAGKAGQRVVASCLASSIDSRLHAWLQLFGPESRLLAAGREYKGTDAVLDATLPADGDYDVRVSAFTYTQGGPEHFYRLTVSTGPWIDAVLPPMVEPGKETRVTVYGRNLPGGRREPSAVLDGQVLEKATAVVRAPTDPEATHRLAFTGQVAARSASLDGFEFRLRNDTGWSNPYLLSFAHAPVVLENESHDTPNHAQEVAPPCEIAGRIEKRGDQDWYRFTARKGDVYSIEAFGDRLESPLDLYFTLGRAGDPRPPEEFDDNPEILHPTQFFTRTEDPARQRWVAPADGEYLLRVSSREAAVSAGPRHLYRVRIGPERPDFRLIVLPTLNLAPRAALLGAGGLQSFTVLVCRQDGFEGEVTLSAEGLPPGVSCPPQVIGPRLRVAGLVLRAAEDAPPWTGTITVRGTARIGGEQVAREARPATTTWPVPQANVPALSRLDRALVLAVRERAPFRLDLAADRETVRPGQKVTLTVKFERLRPDVKGPIQLTLLNPLPANLLSFNNNQPLTLGAGQGEARGTLDVKANLPPGRYTLVLRGQTTFPFSRDPQGKQKQNAAATLPSTPVTIEVAK